MFISLIYEENKWKITVFYLNKIAYNSLKNKIA